MWAASIFKNFFISGCVATYIMDPLFTNLDQKTSDANPPFHNLCCLVLEAVDWKLQQAELDLLNLLWTWASL